MAQDYRQKVPKAIRVKGCIVLLEGLYLQIKEKDFYAIIVRIDVI